MGGVGEKQTREVDEVDEDEEEEGGRLVREGIRYHPVQRKRYLPYLCSPLQYSATIRGQGGWVTVTCAERRVESH